MTYFMTQWYIFQDLTDQEVLDIQKTLKQIGQTNDMNGLILLAHEGCNGTVAGSAEAIETIRAYLMERFPGVSFQDWTSDTKPFKRFKVDIREEIVALKSTRISTPPSLPLKRGGDDVSPPYQGGVRGGGSVGRLSPKQFHEMMQQENVAILDTRNSYETKIGTFEKAIDPQLTSFHEFPKFVEESNIPKNKPVLMFCTSGIRCEKASQEMEQQGYEEVYQLDGGITNYLKEYPDGKWNGECFMFDHRVAVDSNLQPSKRWALCPICGNPGDVVATCSQCPTESKYCAPCLHIAPATCSRACRHTARQNEVDKVDK